LDAFMNSECSALRRSTWVEFPMPHNTRERN